MAESTEKKPREKLLNTASDLFHRQGFHSTGINQIIREAGVAKATFYHHFPSKEALGMAWLDHVHQDWNERLREHTEAVATPGKKILAVFAFLTAYLRASNFRGCVFLNVLSEFPEKDNPLRVRVTNHKEEVRKLIEGYAEQLSADGKPLKPKKIKALAETVFLLLEGAYVESQVTGDVWPVEAAERAVKRMLKDV